MILGPFHYAMSSTRHFQGTSNRIKSLLPKCISQEQSAFVENQSIIDNVMVAYEIVHHMKCKKKVRVGEVVMKIDISNAYDRV